MPAQLPDNARCLQCDYLLRGLNENKCPECGANFDPANPTTYREPQIPAHIYRWVRPASRIVPPIVAVFAVTLQYAARGSREFDRFLAIALLAIGLALGLDTLARKHARNEIRRQAPDNTQHQDSWPDDRHRLMPIAWTVIALVLLTSIVGINIPLLVAFQFSRPALEREIASIRTRVPYGTPGFVVLNKRVGAFDVSAVRVDPGNNFTFWGDELIYSESTPIPDSLWLAPHWRIKRPRL